jgi:D-arabinose 1-dehydrogenase-like Zn-dependent alcohol dehydrogenase
MAATPALSAPSAGAPFERTTIEHGIKLAIELIRADAVGDAYDRVERSDVRYRFVIDVATID